MGTHGAISLTLEDGTHQCVETTLDGGCVYYNWEGILKCLISKHLPPLDVVGTSVHEAFGVDGIEHEREREQMYFIGVNHATKVISLYNIVPARREEYKRLYDMTEGWEIDGEGDCLDDSPCYEVKDSETGH